MSKMVKTRTWINNEVTSALPLFEITIRNTTFLYNRFTQNDLKENEFQY